MCALKALGHHAAWTLAFSVALDAPVRAQDDVQRLAPSSNWVMDYADESCALRRTFGDEQHRVWLEFRQYAPGDEFLVTVASGALDARQREPRSRFEPDGPLREQPLTAYGTYGNAGEGVSFPDTLRPETSRDSPSSLPPWDAAQREARERSITGLYLAEAFQQKVFLETGKLHEPMVAMQTCLADLLTHWGIDPEADLALSQRVKPRNMARWAAQIQALFPRQLLYVGARSRITFRLLVDPAGKLEACKVVRPVVDDSYEKTVCDIMFDQAQFDPARDASGQPVKSYHLLSVVYLVT